MPSENRFFPSLRSAVRQFFFIAIGRLAHAIIVALTLVYACVTVTQAEDPPPAMSEAQCISGYQNIGAETLACYKALSERINLKANDAREDIASYVCRFLDNFGWDYSTGRAVKRDWYSENHDECVKNWLASHPVETYEKLVSEGANILGFALADLFVLEFGSMRECENNQRQKEKELHAACANYPNARTAYCDVRQTLALASKSSNPAVVFLGGTPPDWGSGAVCADRPFAKLAKGSTLPKTLKQGRISNIASIDLAKLGCASAKTIVQACFDSCTDQDKETCLPGCRALQERQTALCLASLSESVESNPPGKSQRKPNLNVRDKVDAKSFGTAKDSGGQKPASKTNLDRFDLGPTFVSPDSSSTVSRTARGAGSSKPQTKTLKPVGGWDAPPPSNPIPLGGGIGGTVIERPK